MSKGYFWMVAGRERTDCRLFRSERRARLWLVRGGFKKHKGCWYKNGTRLYSSPDYVITKVAVVSVS